MLEIDLREFEQRARELSAAADQVPFALANAMTTAAFKTKDYLANDLWPQHVTARNRTFMRATLRVEKAMVKQFRAYGEMTVDVYDQLGRVNLNLHDRGGIRVPAKGGSLAVPADYVADKRGSRGVPQSLRPRALPNSFRKGDAIYQRVGKNGRHLRLMYVLKPVAKQKPDVPFRDTFATVMLTALREAFPAAIAKAMQSRRAG